MHAETIPGFELYHQGDTGHAIVLLPGLCGSKMELGLIPALLIAANHTVAIPIIEGYSSHAGFTEFSHWLECVNMVCNDLRSNHQSISIVGMSLGATLALGTEARFKNIDNLVCLSSTLKLDGWSIPWYHSLLKLAYQIGFRRWVYHETEPFGVKDLRLRHIIAKAVSMNHVSSLGAAQLPARHIYQSLELMTWTRKHLSEVTSNLLVIHSTDDDTASIKNAHEVLNNVQSSIKESLWVQNSYHMISVDNEKQEVANKVKSFLDTVLTQQ
jgi:carboxylesterase